MGKGQRRQHNPGFGYLTQRKYGSRNSNSGRPSARGFGVADGRYALHRGVKLKEETWPGRMVQVEPHVRAPRPKEQHEASSQDLGAAKSHLGRS